MSPEEVLYTIDCAASYSTMDQQTTLIDNYNRVCAFVSLLCDWLQIKAWEEAELNKPIDMEQIRIDPSPFQLVERTSLHKVIIKTHIHILVLYTYNYDLFSCHDLCSQTGNGGEKTLHN